MCRIIFFLFITTILATGKDIPFERGVNLTGWFQVSGPAQIQFTRFTKKDFINLKEMGIDHIRLPINLHAMTGATPDYTLDPLFLFFLDQVVDWTEELGIHLIIDNHTFDPAVDTDPDINQILVPVWTQMANHFKNRSKSIYYEILNEPHGITDSRWNEIQQEVVDAIRMIDTKHTIVIGPAGWNSYHNLQYMPTYADTNLIYTFHFYDPFLFTHQGASWTDPSMVSLAGVPFPYENGAIPACPQDLKGTWIEDNLNNYSYEGTISRTLSLLNIAVSFAQQNDVPMFCGEFGVFIPNSDNADRVFWHNLIRTYLEQQGIAWSIWSYNDGFGLFEPGTDELFDYDLNVPLVEALGLTAPPQMEYVQKPDSTGFPIFSDYIETGIESSGWMDTGTLSFYSEDDPQTGKFCIYWEGAAQYNQIGFNFKPDKDLSQLVRSGSWINFGLRSDAANAVFDIRFIDSKTEDPDDHPWRMRYVMDQSVVLFDGQWHEVSVPLSEFSEHGSWDNGWFDPQGDFDWTEVDRFEIVAEHQNLSGVQMSFDDIKIVSPNTSIEGNRSTILGQMMLFQNFPNPFNPSTLIRYALPARDKVRLDVYDQLGRKIASLIDEEQQTGIHEITWKPAQLSSGIYYYKLTSSGFTKTKKMLLLR